MPKVSVLMPIYNTPVAFLKEAIESVLSQTWTDFEFLILNDSPENKEIEDVVLSYPDERIKYSKNEQNLGITPSRNKLIEMSTGEYLAVMDHDDVSLPTRFEKQAAFLDTHKEIGVVGCFSEQNTYPIFDKDIKLALMNQCVILHPASMIRKSVLNENNLRYEEEYSPSEDYALWARLISLTQFYNIPEKLFFYRKHATNTTKTQRNKMHTAGLAIRALIKIENPLIYEEFLLKATHKTQVKLFGIIPFISIIKKTPETTIKLFCFLTIFSYRTKKKYQGNQYTKEVLNKNDNTPIKGL